MTVRVNVYFSTLDGSAHYRLTEPCRELMAQGADVSLFPLGVETRDCDVIVLNRPILREQAELVGKLTADGYAVVVDMDDDFDSLRTSHTMYGRLDTRWLHEACRAATLVTCTTEALAARYGYGHARVIPNFVPDWYWDWAVPPEKAHESVWVGWSGTVGSHPGDLQTIPGVMTKVHDQTGAQLAYVGPKHDMDLVRKALRYKGPGLVAGWFVLEDYPKAIAEFDVGIVPLEDNTFNQSKSWLKGLELASVGVPFVASPTPDYRKLAAHGVGVLAETRNQWARELVTLVRDPEAGVRMREAAYGLRLSANVHLWLEAFEAALVRPTGRQLRSLTSSLD